MTRLATLLLCLPPLALVLALAPARADDPPAAAKAKEGDRARLQGVWAGKLGSQKVDILMEITGDKLVMTVTSASEPNNKYVIKGDFKLDETKDPKWWDFLHGKSSDGRDLADGKAIYDLSGDTLKLYNNLPNRDRPANFKDIVPDSTQLIVFTRQKKSGDPPKDAPAPAPAPAPPK